jgi:hypothetical protein
MGHTCGTITGTVNIKKKENIYHIGKIPYIKRIGENILHMNYTNVDSHNLIFRTLQERNTS